MSNKIKKIIISGGGTGGHVFPAISIAEALKAMSSDVEILFAGAEGKMEMEKVPAAGYKIVGLPVAGFHRRLTLRNLALPFKLVRSLAKASRIIDEFKPDIAVGVGGFASWPVLRQAARRGIPTLIQEQNSYAGLTNKLLGKRAACICTAYENMDKFFPEDKIILTGNPIRKDLFDSESIREEAKKYFESDGSLKTVLIMGGSLGALTINESVAEGLDKTGKDYRIIWQTGKHYFDKARQIAEGKGNVKVVNFISRMDYAYSVADLIVSRAGAGTISELSVVGKPVILIPSPNVAEDHQTKNAKALVNKGAAVMIADLEAKSKLMDTISELISDAERCNDLSVKIRTFAKPNAAKNIAAKILELIDPKN